MRNEGRNVADILNCEVIENSKLSWRFVVAPAMNLTGRAEKAKYRQYPRQYRSPCRTEIQKRPVTAGKLIDLKPTFLSAATAASCSKNAC
jgi:hypothetical protein